MTQKTFRFKVLELLSKNQAICYVDKNNLIIKLMTVTEFVLILRISTFNKLL